MAITRDGEGDRAGEAEAEEQGEGEGLEEAEGATEVEFWPLDTTRNASTQGKIRRMAIEFYWSRMGGGDGGYLGICFSSRLFEGTKKDNSTQFNTF